MTDAKKEEGAKDNTKNVKSAGSLKADGGRLTGKSAEKKAFVYLGPNLPGGVLFSGGVYKDKPERLKALFERVPEIEKLFIDVKDAPAFKKSLSVQGSEAFRLYHNVEMSVRKGGILR